MTHDPTSIDDLAPHPRNPRRIKDANARGLRKSLERFGDLSGITYNTHTGRLVSGHQRLKELRELGYRYVGGVLTNGETDFGVRLVDWDEQFELEANVAANNEALQGEWFELDGILQEIRAGMDAAEFEELRFDALADTLKIDLDPLDGDDEDEVPEPPAEPVTKPGDVWVLGEHVLVCGDSTDERAVQPAIALSPFIMVTDPPYGVEYDPDWRKGFTGQGRPRAKKLAIGKVTNDDSANWRATYNLFVGSVAYVWCASMKLADVLSDLVGCGLVSRALLIWRKQNFLFGRGHYHWQHEPCWYAVRKGKSAKWCGDRTQSTIWDIENAQGWNSKRVAETDGKHTTHSTQKPLECMARPIRNHGDKNDAVYDPFLGSGTTLIAAEKLGRRCGGLEIDPGYCDVIIDRWQNLTGGQAKRA